MDPVAKIINTIINSKDGNIKVYKLEALIPGASII